MKKTTILLIFLFALYANAQNNAFPQKMYEQNPDRGIRFDISSLDLSSPKKCKALIKQMQRKNSSSEYYKELYTLYTIAACYDKLKKHDSTICYLTKFMDKARDDRYILIGNDFNNLKANSLKWKPIVNRIEQSYLQLLGDNMDKELALKIFHMGVRRLRLMEDGAFNPSEDLKIIEEMEKIVDKQGMPTYSNVGNYASCNAAHTLWYSEKLPQYYSLIQNAFLQGEMRDTVLFMKISDTYITRFMEKKQIYGTIFIYNGITGKLVLEPIESIDAVNKARREIGVTETLEEYTKNKRNHIIPEQYLEKKEEKDE